jgi:ribosome modulation factor
MSKQRQPTQAERQALNEGAAAARAGKTDADCPYRDAISLRFMWLTGFAGVELEVEAERKRAKAAEDQRKLDVFPELLEALRDLMPTFEMLERNGYRIDPKRVNAARAVIAKATGEQA